MSVGNEEKWILVEWGNGIRGIVHARYLVNVENRELHAGCSVVVGRRGEQQIATFLARSNERPLLEQILKESEAADEAGAGPSAPYPQEEDPGDFSGSASSWAPNEDDTSDSSGPEDEESTHQTIVKKTKFKQNVYEKEQETTRERISKRVLTPSNRVNAIIPNNMRKHKGKKTNKNKTRKRKFEVETENVENKNPANLSKKDVQIQPKTVNVAMPVDDIIAMKQIFKELFRIIRDMRRDYETINEEEVIEPPKIDDVFPEENAPNVQEEAEIEMQESRSEDLNRSDDNVLITNKYDKVANIQQEKEDVYNIQNEVNNDEWVPIGSGKTLIHKDKFRKIKWTSYTMATRGLLLAVFPRRTLATHSLTGKRSPAFQNKPAKMCLDPKKVSDIIIEVMDRFRVRENLIRSIITTKCADECKMFKMRMEKKKGPIPKNENMPPAAAERKVEPIAKQN